MNEETGCSIVDRPTRAEQYVERRMPEAERIAWLWCAIRRDTIDAARATVELRAGGTEALTPTEVGDLATLWAADTVEQIRRMTPDEQGFSRGLAAVLAAASPPAQHAVRALDAPA